jgi:hypothetical protein
VPDDARNKHGKITGPTDGRENEAQKGFSSHYVTNPLTSARAGIRCPTKCFQKVIHFNKNEKQRVY